MRVLIVIGAGASQDSWPGNGAVDGSLRLPLANKLFAPLDKQNFFLNQYDLMGVASILRRRARASGDDFDIEAELASVSDKANTAGDLNNIQALFKTRFYLHSLINELTKFTLNSTSSHTTYVDLLGQLKEWIDDSPRTRNVDIVTFNYDNLIEKAMENVYPYDWGVKNKTPMTAYYSGTNLRIYKPHGSINWGRKVEGADEEFSYRDIKDAFTWFNKIYLKDDFEFVEPDIFSSNIHKTYIPAVAVPLKGKTDFQECPEMMFEKMIAAISAADKLVTIGWKGSDNHFVDLLKSKNEKIKEAHIISPRGNTNLGEIYPNDQIKVHAFGFREFVSDSAGLSNLLNSFA